jgi:hypothetical protein
MCIFKSYLPDAQLNNVLSPKSRSLKWTLTIRFSNQIFTLHFVPPWVHPVNINRQACCCSPHCLTSSFIVLCSVCSDLWITVTKFLAVHNQVQVYSIMSFGCLDSNLRVNFLDWMMTCISHIHFISPMCCCYAQWLKLCPIYIQFVFSSW